MREPLGIPIGEWSIAKREELANAALAQIPPRASEQLKLALLVKLVKALQELREYDRWDPRQMESVALKQNYRQVR